MMAAVTYRAAVDLMIGGKIRPAGADVPEAAKWRNLGSYIRTGQIVADGPGSREVMAQWKKEQPRGRPLNRAFLAEAIRRGDDADGDLDAPLVTLPDDVGEAYAQRGMDEADAQDEVIEEALEAAAAEQPAPRRKRKR